MDFKQQISHRRAHLAIIGVFLVCIVFVYQGLGSPPSSSTGLQHEESSSAVISAKQSAQFKPPVDLRTSDNATHNVSPTGSILDTAHNGSRTQTFSDSQHSNVSSEILTIQSSDTQNSSEILTTHNVSSEAHITQSSDSKSDTPISTLAGKNSSEVLTTRNVSSGILSTQRSDSSKKRREIPEWRVKVEDELRKAKLGIDLASPKSMELDAQVTKSVYINAYKFYKSYELMERMFKVYMYKEGEPRLVHRGPLTGIYSSEGRFIHEMNQNTHFVTDDPQEAHMFFLPYSTVHMRADLYVPDSHSMLPISTYIKNYVNLIALKHPFWNLTRGSDHFFVSCHDWGPATARDHPELRKNAVKVVCNADLTEEYVLDKDASLPETLLHGVKLPARLGGPGPTKRSILAFFAGQLHGRVRPTLLEHWKDKDPDMKIYEVIPRDVAKRTSYIQHMKMSKFCICAMGYEVNSPRIVESLYYDCVPVIIADNFVLPFSDVLNWDSFSLTVAEKDIPRLKDILLSVSDVRYGRMQGRLKKVRKHFMWHDSGERFDIFHMILHSVWTRRLQQLDRITSLETEV